MHAFVSVSINLLHEKPVSYTNDVFGKLRMNRGPIFAGSLVSFSYERPCLTLF